MTDCVTVQRAPFRYQGAKLYLENQYQISKYFPRDYVQSRPFVSLFLGSGVLFWNIKPLWAILNDKDDLIYNFFDVLQNHCNEFEDAMKFVWSGQKWKEVFKTREDSIGKAVWFALRCLGQRFQKPSILKKDYQFYAELLDKTHVDIWHRDFREAFDLIENSRWGWDERRKAIAWIDEDPPYVGQEGVYAEDFTEKDHRDLSVLNHNTRHNVILQYRDHPLVRELYADWHILELPFYSRNTHKSHVELLLSNRPFKNYKQNDITSWARRA